MTFAELAALRERVEELRFSRGGAPVKLADLSGIIAGPDTLDGALTAEATGAVDGHVEFRDGTPAWVPGPPRFTQEGR